MPLAKIAVNALQIVQTPHLCQKHPEHGTETAEDSPGGMCMSGRSLALLRTKGSLVIAVVLGFEIGRLGGTHFSSLQWHPPPSGEAYAEEMDQQQSLQKGKQTMKIVRVYTGADNKSHFEDTEVPLKSGGKAGSLSDLVKATGVIFRETGGDYNFDFHNAPRRQYVVNLEGEVEIEVGDGTKRILRTGDILLAEDTTGQGHISRAVGGKPRKSLFITLD
jgi:hypothetical protein